VIFLERCKGFEEDAKRFIIMTQDTKNMQIDYKLLRPMFLRAIKNKTGNDVLQLFEQFRKNIKLNRSADQMPAEEKSTLLRQIKKEVYDGLIKDLLNFKAYPLC
jgi:phosphoenolpyruvate carboxylase